MVVAAFPTVTVSVVYVIWDSCRRWRRRRAARSPLAAEPLSDDEKLQHRLNCLTLVMKPLSGRRGG
jgi:hypothetical protein